MKSREQSGTATIALSKVTTHRLGQSAGMVIVLLVMRKTSAKILVVPYLPSDGVSCQDATARVSIEKGRGKSMVSIASTGTDTQVFPLLNLVK